jgi:mannose-6-phosphate isomerase-like protein (cupin superfamily)
MYVIEQPIPVPAAIPGIDHATWAGHDQGLSQISLWRQAVASGAGTPVHKHDCDEVVLCLAGQGQLHIDGQVHAFGANCTLVLPRGRAHQLLNTGPGALQLLGIFGSTPVGTFADGGEALDLPWRT